jgi:hypothetical protein
LLQGNGKARVGSVETLLATSLPMPFIILGRLARCSAFIDVDQFIDVAFCSSLDQTIPYYRVVARVAAHF